MAFSFGGAAATPSFGFGTPAPAAAPAATFGGFGAAPAAAPAATFGGFGAAPAAAAAPAAGGFGFGTPAPAAAAPAATFGGFGGGFGAAAPAAGGFGAAPATGGFGFGAPAAAAAPATTGGFGFGTAPATTGFGAAAAPATGGFGFGGFGTQPAAAQPSFGGFGAQPAAQPQPQQQQQVAAAAAATFPAHSIEARLLAIRSAYSASSPDCRFQTVFYNKVDSATVGQYVKPPHANSRLWEAAVKANPDPAALVPSLAVGFEDLKKRIHEQEKASAAFGTTLDAMSASLATMIHGHEASTAASLAQLQRTHAQQSHRLLQLVDRVECARARDVTPRLPEEMEFEHKLRVLERALKQPQPLQAKIQQLAQAVKQLEARGAAAAAAGGVSDDASGGAAAQANNSSASWLLNDEAANEKLFHFLQTQRSALEHVTGLLKQDQRDLQTIQAVTQQAGVGI